MDVISFMNRDLLRATRRKDREAKSSNE